MDPKKKQPKERKKGETKLKTGRNILVPAFWKVCVCVGLSFVGWLVLFYIKYSKVLPKVMVSIYCMYTKAGHCTVGLDKAALTSSKLVWCC